MENPFPKFNLFPRITRVAQTLGRWLTPLPTEAPLHMSDYYRGPDTEGEALEPVIELVTVDPDEVLRLVREAQRAKGENK